MIYKGAYGLPVLLAALLAGCATPQPPKAEPIDPVLKELREAASSAANSQKKIAETDAAAQPKKSVVVLPKQVDPAVAKRVDIDWTGEGETLAAKMAAEAGYKFTVSGRKPAIPVLVSVSNQDVRVADVLRDIGLQCGTRATVTISSAAKAVVFHYEN